MNIQDMNVRDSNIRRTGGFGSLPRLIAPAANVRDPLKLRLLAGIAVVVPKAENINCWAFGTGASKPLTRRANNTEIRAAPEGGPECLILCGITASLRLSHWGYMPRKLSVCHASISCGGGFCGSLALSFGSGRCLFARLLRGLYLTHGRCGGRRSVAAAGAECGTHAK